jgi:hypothetical protein
MLSVQMWRIMTKIFNKQVDENELHASEALYHSLGYAMNTYIQNLKGEKDNSVWKEVQELNEFNVYIVINKMKIYRDMIDKDYLHIAKKRYVEYNIQENEKKILNDKELEDVISILNSVQLAALKASNEFTDSLHEYKVNETINYSVLPKNIKSMIDETVLFFHNIIVSANNMKLKLVNLY